MKDVVIIGAGIIGAAVARELARYNLDVLVLEKESDVANGTTKANSAIVHAGYDAKEHTLMAKYNALGNPMFDALCKDLDVPFQRCGSVVLAFSDTEVGYLRKLLERGRVNGVPGLRIVDQHELRQLEPHVSRRAVAGLYAETAGIVGAWELAIALLENAVENGVQVRLQQEVVGISHITPKSSSGAEGYRITMRCGVTGTLSSIDAHTIINAAGVYADTIHNMVAEPAFSITPRRGEYYVLDKSQESLVKHVVFQCPTAMGKGVLITPTVHGNMLLGPDAEDVEQKDDTATSAQQLAYVKSRVSQSVDNIPFHEVIRTFAGLRAQSDQDDFILEEAKGATLFFDVAGIRSPGLSAAPAIGMAVADMVVAKLGDLLQAPHCKGHSKGRSDSHGKPHASRHKITKKSNFQPKRVQKVFMKLSSKEQAQLVQENPAYGRMVCRCEHITEGEIIDAIRRPLGATTVDGIKRRCRPGTGRCQGGFCAPRVQEILARELGLPMEQVVMDRPSSYILTGATKSAVSTRLHDSANPTNSAQGDAL